MSLDPSGSLILFLENNEITEFDSETLRKTRTFELETNGRLKSYYHAQRGQFIYFDSTGKNLYFHSKDSGKTELIYSFENEVLMNYFGKF